MSFKTKFDQMNSNFDTNFSSSNSFNICFAASPGSSVTVISKTTAEWNAQIELISKKNIIYVYTDHQQTINEKGEVINIPGMKIGDGLAYLIDLPFMDTLYADHIENNTIHITENERIFWNNKVTAYYVDSEENSENLILTKNFIIE